MSRISDGLKSLLQAGPLAGHFLWRLPSGSDVALTFDDGPNPEYTGPVLELLARHGIKATFFVVGETVQRFPALLREVVAAGHGVGAHSQTHRDFPTLDRAALLEELRTCRRVIAEVSGVDTLLVRPPRGRLSPAVLWHARRAGYRIVHWSRTYSDYLRDGAEPLARRIRANPPRARDIVLLHDNNAFTVRALGEVLPEWVAAGRRFAAL